MTDFAAKGEDLQMTIQGLVQARSNIRSAENLVDTVSALANPETKAELEHIVVQLQGAASTIQEIYKRNAREAFGDKGYKAV